MACENHLLIAFNSKALQEICHQSSAAIKSLGAVSADALHARLSDIQAALNVFDLPVGNVTIYENNCHYIYKDLVRVLMVPNYGVIDPGEVFDWESVHRIKIMGINDVA
jgi:hypothetical protein